MALLLADRFQSSLDKLNGEEQKPAKLAATAPVPGVHLDRAAPQRHPQGPQRRQLRGLPLRPGSPADHQLKNEQAARTTALQMHEERGMGLGEISVSPHRRR